MRQRRSSITSTSVGHDDYCYDDLATYSTSYPGSYDHHDFSCYGDGSLSPKYQGGTPTSTKSRRAGGYNSVSNRNGYTSSNSIGSKSHYTPPPPMNPNLNRNRTATAGTRNKSRSGNHSRGRSHNQSKSSMPPMRTPPKYPNKKVSSNSVTPTTTTTLSSANHSNSCKSKSSSPLRQHNNSNSSSIQRKAKVKHGSNKISASSPPISTESLPSVSELQRRFGMQQRQAAMVKERRTKADNDKYSPPKISRDNPSVDTRQKVSRNQQHVEVVTDHVQYPVQSHPENDENDMNIPNRYLNPKEDRQQANDKTMGTSLTAMREKIFGESPSNPRNNVGCNQDYADTLKMVQRRKLSNYTVLPTTAGKWLLTISNPNNYHNGNSSGNDGSGNTMKAYSFATEEEAKSAGAALAPPLMTSKKNELNSRCTVCDKKFAVLKRPHHCRNCGSCVCSSCSVHWPSKMAPDTYNFRNERTVRVCNTCEWVKESFRRALIEGDMERSISMFETGNVNIRCAFANVKGDIMFPVHCAAQSGNLELFKWLVESNHCPIATSSQCDRKQYLEPLLTSKGKDVLSIAMKYNYVPLVRYLVVEKKFSLASITSARVLQRVLETTLRIISIEDCNDTSTQQDPELSYSIIDDSTVSSCETVTIPTIVQESAPAVVHTSAFAHDNISCLPTRDESFEEVENDNHSLEDEQKTISESKERCIICFSNPLDCVFTPCGHLCCCMECGERIMSCPMCGQKCYSIKTSKPY